MKQRLNVFLLTDMEGIAGINDIGEMDRTAACFSLSCEKLCASINLAVNACFDAGADRVYYLDGHGGGGNVNAKKIDRRATKCSLEEWQELLKNGEIDCQIELGAHARAGTIGGFLDHTISSTSIYSIKINDMEMSEFSLHAILCAKYNVPIIAVIGDEVACKQAQEYIPEIYCGAVKVASCRNVATTDPDADRILVDTVKTALANRASVPCIQLQEPLCVEQSFYRTDMCESALANCSADVLRVNARTLQKEVQCISSYFDLKF
ncbi:MAG: M55 family metallopeptidase [Clostridia bacterium]|nr:M55 family metallopeptidase [Clostridia bacterium]